MFFTPVSEGSSSYIEPSFITNWCTQR